MISRLGRFEIQAEIGRGGFGQVYRAFDPVMNRVVAIKVLTTTEDASLFNRFKNEATAAGNLRHENIVTIHEFGQEGDIPFLVMQHLDGETLESVIQKRSMNLYQKVRVMDRVADGLHCAHRNGVLHRDVKPANIMVLRDGGVKIMDFGIARITRDTSTRLTPQGYVVGTVVYMAPELFRNSEVDALCDIWSYGVILYELLAGRNPFRSGSVQSEIHRICDQDVEPLPPDVCPKELQMAVTKLLSRPRASRYQSLEDTRLDLQPVLENLEREEADRLLANARQLLSQQKWDEALAVVREARRIDPQNAAARIVFELAQAKLQLQPKRPGTDDLRAKIAEGRRLLNTGQVREAEEFVLAHLVNQREDSEVMSLGRDIVAEKRRRESARAIEGQRTAFVAECLRVAQALEQKGDLAGALGCLQKGLARYPENPELASARRRQFLTGIRQTLDSSNWSQALQLIEAARPESPNDPAWNSLQDEALGQRQAFLESASAAIRKKLAENRTDEARTLFDQNLASYQDQANVKAVAAEIAAADEPRRAFVSKNLKRAADCEQAADYPRAVRTIQKALENYPADAELSATLSRLQSAMVAAAGTPVATARHRTSRGRLVGIGAVVLVGVAIVAYWMRPPPRQPPKVVPAPTPIATPDRPPGPVQPPPPEVQPASLKFLYERGGAVPQPQKITVAGSPDVKDPQKSAAWMTLTRGKTTAGQTEFVVQLVTNQLLNGKEPYTDDLIFAADKKVHVEVDVQGYDVWPRELSFNYQHGGAPPAPQYVALFGATDVVAPQKKIAWLNVIRRRAGDGRTDFQVQLLQPENIAAGNYSDDLIFPVQKKKVHVSVLIQPKAAPPPPPPPPPIEVTPTTLTFAYQRGDPPLKPQSIRVTGAADVPEPKKNASWIALKRSVSGETTEFAVQIITDNLDQNHYTDDLIFPQQKKVHVELVIKEAPAPVIAPAPPQTRTIKLTDGLKFAIALAEDVAKDCEPDQPLKFKAAQDVIVDGVVVIAKVAPVKGVVVEAAKRSLKTFGLATTRPTFRLLEVTAVDGSKVKVRASLTPRGEKGKDPQLDPGSGVRSRDAIAPAGSQFAAYLDGNQTVTVRK